MDALEARQLVPSPNDDGRTSRARLCQSVNLPANGVLMMPDGELITLSGAAAYKPSCTANTQPAIIAGAGGSADAGNGVSVDETAEIGGPHFSDLRDPFYASTFPQCYALAATTVIAYTLVIMLVITPRSFLDGGVVVLGRRGFTNGGSASGTIGGRPWLQKVAALTVAISLTIATADTFRVAEEQYAFGLQDARELQDKVLGGTELKIIRIISDTFLWLAQAQTLIRLFPRQREKVIIKWTAFALITFDLIFDSLNSFQYTGPGNTRPGSFTDAIPALSYLFQLALGVLYAAWVIYYSLMKKRYAYYHPQMKNICLVAVLSLFAILVPVVFFILDISKPEFTGWGDYVRWVGAAAASVIVWEWVERIEALEREEKRDGILGREVFDGDEMLENLPDSGWPRRNRMEKPPRGAEGDDDGDGADGGEDGEGRVNGRGHAHGRGSAPAATGRSNIWPSMSSIANRYRSRHHPASDDAAPEAKSSRQPTNHNKPTTRFLQPPLWPSRPPPAVTPVSRTDTASADSTVYAIRYHPLTETTSRTTVQPTPPPTHLSSIPLSSDQRQQLLPLLPPPPPPQQQQQRRRRREQPTSSTSLSSSSTGPSISNSGSNPISSASSSDTSPSHPSLELRPSSSVSQSSPSPAPPLPAAFAQLASPEQHTRSDTQRLESRLARSNSVVTATSRAAEAPSSPTDVGARSQDSASARRWRALAQVIPFRRSQPSGSGSGSSLEQIEGRAQNSSSSNSNNNNNINNNDSGSSSRYPVQLQPYSSQSQPQHEGQTTRWDLRTRMEDFAAIQAERIRERIRPTPDTASLPVTVIPAPPRRGAALAQLLEEEESSQTHTQGPGQAQQAQYLQRNHSHATPSSPPLSPALWRRNSTGSVSSLNSPEAAASRVTYKLRPLIVTTASGRTSIQDLPDDGRRDGPLSRQPGLPGLQRSSHSSNVGI